MNSAAVMGNTVIFYTSAEDVSGQSQQELHEIEKLLEKQGDPWAVQVEQKSFQDT